MIQPSLERRAGNLVRINERQRERGKQRQRTSGEGAQALSNPCIGPNPRLPLVNWAPFDLKLIDLGNYLNSKHDYKNFEICRPFCAACLLRSKSNNVIPRYVYGVWKFRPGNSVLSVFEYI